MSFSIVKKQYLRVLCTVLSVCMVFSAMLGASAISQDETYSYEKSIDYTSVSANMEIIQGSDMSALGLYDKLGVCVCPSPAGDDAAGLASGPRALSASYGYLIKHSAYDAWQGNSYAVYSVMPGTDFKAVIYYDARCNAVETALNMAENSWTAKLYTSADGASWTLCDNVLVNVLAENGARTETVRVRVSNAASFVKIEFPQAGRMDEVTENAIEKVGNDFMGVRQVAYTPGYEYEKIIDYSTATERPEIIPAEDMPALGLDVKLGLAVGGVGEKRCLKASYGYIAKAPNYDAYTGNPYAVYSVKPGTDFKAVISYVISLCNAKEDALGIDRNTWVAKFYTSPDGEIWTEKKKKKAVAVNGNVRTEITQIHLGSDVNFVKIELPQKFEDNDKGGIGHEFIGINEVGYTPIYERMINYTSMPNTIEIIGDADEEVLGLYDHLGMSLADFGSGKALSASYGYLIKHPAYDTWNGNPYAVYEVNPGTDFKAVISYNKTICDNITNQLGESWVTKLFFSENGEDWTLYNGQLTSKENDGIRTDTFEAELGSKIKYVKIELPHTGRMDEVAPGAAISVGNDYMGIEQVCFTPYGEKTAVNETVKQGDLNGDGNVDSVDLALLRKALLSDNAGNNAVCEINGVNGIDILDLVKLKKLITA